MALKNYVNRVGPILDAAWLNQVDLLVNALTGNPSNLGSLALGPPQSGTALGINSLAGNYGLVIGGSAGNVAYIGLAGNGNSAGATDFVLGQDGASNAVITNRAAASLSIGTNSVSRITISATGNIVASSPTSGAAITINGTNSGAYPLQLNYSSAPSSGGAQIATTNNSLVQPMVYWNKSAGTAAVQVAEFANDTVGSALELFFWHTSTGFTGSIAGCPGLGATSGIGFGQHFYLTPGPSASGGPPMGIGISTTGNITMGAPPSGNTLSISALGGTANGLDISAGSGIPCGLAIRGDGLASGRGLRLNVDGAGNAQIYLVNPGASLGIGANGTTAILMSSTGDVSGRGIPLCKFKAAPTTQASTTTLINDPDLAVSIPGAGTYRFSILLQVSQGGAGAVGIALNTNFSGTITNPGSYAIASTRNAAAGFSGGATLSISSTVNNVLFSANNVATIAGIDWFEFEGVLTCSTAGTFAVAWAQNTNSATATKVDAGSCLTLMQLN